MIRRPPKSPLFPSTTPSRSGATPITGLTAGELVARAYGVVLDADADRLPAVLAETCPPAPSEACAMLDAQGLWWQLLLDPEDRKSTRLNSSHANISYAVFCL